MFPNNPLFVDKLVQSRQEDIERGIPDPHTYDLRLTPQCGLLTSSPYRFQAAPLPRCPALLT